MRFGKETSVVKYDYNKYEHTYSEKREAVIVKWHWEGDQRASQKRGHL